MNDRTPLLETRQLKKHFPVDRGGLFGKSTATVKAVDGVDISIYQGQTFSLAGESGCGKTTLGNLILRLEHPTSGELIWQGKNIDHLTKDEARAYRRSVQAVFQDPWSSLNSKLRVRRIIAEPLVINEELTREQIETKVLQSLQQVALLPGHADRFPHEFSGGQRQRIAVARALVLQPRLIVLDEPVSALDVSIRAQIINLLKDLQQEFGLPYFVISHNLATVRYMSDTVAIMYLGKLAELSESEKFFKNPLHPYSRALISASLPADPDRQRDRIVLEGEVPSPINPPSGCRFHTRCPYVMPRCKEEEPLMKAVETGHMVACHLY